MSVSWTRLCYPELLCYCPLFRCTNRPFLARLWARLWLVYRFSSLPLLLHAPQSKATLILKLAPEFLPSVFGGGALFWLPFSAPHTNLTLKCASQTRGLPHGPENEPSYDGTAETLSWSGCARAADVRQHPFTLAQTSKRKDGRGLPLLHHSFFCSVMLQSGGASADGPGRSERHRARTRGRAVITNNAMETIFSMLCRSVDCRSRSGSICDNQTGDFLQWDVQREPTCTCGWSHCSASGVISSLALLVLLMLNKEVGFYNPSSVRLMAIWP